MPPDSLYWQWLAWNRSANLRFLLLWLTTWPLADIGFKQPLHALHRLLYRQLLKINEGGEVNKGGFRRSSFTLLQLFNNPVTDCWGMNQPQSVLKRIYFGDLPHMSQPFFQLLLHCGWYVKVRYCATVGMDERIPISSWFLILFMELSCLFGVKIALQYRSKCFCFNCTVCSSTLKTFCRLHIPKHTIKDSC